MHPMLLVAIIGAVAGAFIGLGMAYWIDQIPLLIGLFIGGGAGAFIGMFIGGSMGGG